MRFTFASAMCSVGTSPRARLFGHFFAMKTAAELSRFYVRVFAITALAVAATSLLACHLIYNATDSLPLGLYWLRRGAEPKRNELVAFPIPHDVRELVHERRY